MVSQKRRAMSVGSRVSKGKENIQSEKLRRPDEIFIRRIELGLSIIRQKIKLRVDRCQELLEKLDKDSRQMKICFLQLMDVIESNRKLVNNEKEENMQLLQLLDAGYTGKADMSSRTQTVNPMIGGLPLKRASISLKRLDPFRELHSHNNTTVILADSLPASDIGFPQPSSSSPLHQGIHPHQMHSQSEDQVVAESPSRHRGRCRRWHEVCNSIVPASRKDLHLKRASIHLKRLDLQSYLPERDIEEVLDSRNMPFEERIVGNVFGVDHLGNTTQSDLTATRQSVCPESGRKCVKCVPHSADPMVVLERLALSSSDACDNYSQNTNTYSARSGVCSMFKNCQMRNDLTTSTERRNNCDTQKDVEHSHQGHETVLLNTQRKRKAQDSYGGIKMKKHIQNNKINSERTKKTGVPKNNNNNNNNSDDNDDEVKKKKSSSKKSNTVIQFSASDANANHPEVIDEDPLEGPSWLYKDGVLKKAKLRKLKKIRQNYLTPFYYLAPTIYSSTDESGDETNDKGKKTNKLRKRKQKKKN